MINYKVGDRVKIVGGMGTPEDQMVGRVGTVVKSRIFIEDIKYFVLVDGFDNPLTSDGTCIYSHANLRSWLGDTRETDETARRRYYKWREEKKYMIRGTESVDYISKQLANENRISQLLPKIKNVIYNRPATIVFWKDGTKTVVKCKGEEFDPEKGLAMAIAKKALGNNYKYYDIFKKWLPNPKAGRGVMKKCDTCEHFDTKAGYDATCDACFDKHVRDHNIISV